MIGFIIGDGMGLMMNGLIFPSSFLVMDFRLIDGFFFFRCDDLKEPCEGMICTASH